MTQPLLSHGGPLSFDLMRSQDPPAKPGGRDSSIHPVPLFMLYSPDPAMFRVMSEDYTVGANGYWSRPCPRVHQSQSARSETTKPWRRAEMRWNWVLTGVWKPVVTSPGPERTPK